MKALLFATVLALASVAHADPLPPSHLDTIMEKGELRVCTTGDYRPYSSLTAAGKLEGIDIDMMESLAASLKARTTFVRTTWAKLLDSLAAGQCDIAAGGVSVTLERQKRAFFADALGVDGKAPLVRCADKDKYRSVADINRPSVRVIEPPGGTNEKFAHEFLRDSALTINPDNLTIFKKLVDGSADVMVTDASEALLQQKLNPGLCAVNPDQPLQYSEKGYMLPRGDVVWKAYVDQWLHFSKATGAYQSTVDHWLK